MGHYGAVDVRAFLLAHAVDEVLQHPSEKDQTKPISQSMDSPITSKTTISDFSEITHLQKSV